MISKPHIAPRERTAKQSNSEHDWAWVLHELAGGRDALKLTRELASRRSDKTSPLYYAQSTVDVASARLWLMEGVPLDDVVTMESHNGASHRKKYDTPPLKGYCQGTKVPHCELFEISDLSGFSVPR